MNNMLLNWYRGLPWFKGKLRFGKLVFKNRLEKPRAETFEAHFGLRYTIPNTIENLGVELFINGVYEQEIVTFLCSKISGSMVFFDIGANIGSVALPVLKRQPGVQYAGFEASPMVFGFLSQNFEQNGIRHFKLFNNLVHRDDGQAMKFYQAEQYGKSSMAPTYATDHVMVKSLSIDQYCKDNGISTIDWMKVDVQGFELYVFEGMVTMLRSKKIRNVLFEFEAWAEEQAGLTPGAAQQFLLQQGYTLYGLDGKPLEISANKNDTMIWARPE